MTRRAFVEFYAEHTISPVRQDLSDLDAHLGRRDTLFHALGVPPRLLRGANVIEFGPGSGHNSVHVARQAPARYVLVDGNPAGIEQTRSTLGQLAPGSTHEIVHSYFEDFDTDERFDLLLAEGCIPFQNDPPAMLAHLVRLIAPGGVVLTNAVTPASYLPETIRRLHRLRLTDPSAPPAAQLDDLRPVFGPHLEALPGRTRFIDDWILDSLVQPVEGTFLTIDDIVDAIGDDFDLISTLPRFATDIRWYKQIDPLQRGFNELHRDAVIRNAHNLIDHRFANEPVALDLGAELERRAAEVWDRMRDAEGGDDGAIAAAAGATREIAAMLRDLAPASADALEEAAGVLDGPDPRRDAPAYAALWGRGSVYVSAFRRPA